MSVQTAPIIREMMNARITLGILQNIPSLGYTVVVTAENGGTRPTPSITPAGGIGNFWFQNTRTTPTL